MVSNSNPKTMKKVKIIFITPTDEIIIANFNKNFYEAFICARALQSTVKTEGYVFYVQYTDIKGTTLRKQP